MADKLPNRFQKNPSNLEDNMSESDSGDSRPVRNRVRTVLSRVPRITLTHVIF